MRAIYRADPEMLAWWASAVECASAISRLERDGALTAAQSEQAFGRLSALRASWHEIQPLDELRTTAVRFLRVHPLRAADALQLAAAFAASEGHPPTLEVVSLDVRLSDAARREGFRVLDVQSTPTRP
ncbi:MAG: type II toxin-antitoxin system VapC family toxin [Vicinamibacterales bacterium]